MDPLQTAELKKRMHYLSIEVASASQLPYRVTRKRTGTIVHSCETRDEAEAKILSMDLAQLAAKPSRGPRR